MHLYKQIIYNMGLRPSIKDTLSGSSPEEVLDVVHRSDDGCRCGPEDFANACIHNNVQHSPTENVGMGIYVYIYTYTHMCIYIYTYMCYSIHLYRHIYIVRSMLCKV